MRNLFYFLAVCLSIFTFKSEGFASDDSTQDFESATSSRSSYPADSFFIELKDQLGEIQEGIQEIKQRTPTHFVDNHQKRANTLLRTDLKNTFLAVAYLWGSYLAWQVESFSPTREKLIYLKNDVTFYTKEDMGYLEKAARFPTALTMPFGAAGVYHLFQVSLINKLITTLVMKPVGNIAYSGYQALNNGWNKIARGWYHLSRDHASQEALKED